MAPARRSRAKSRSDYSALTPERSRARHSSKISNGFKIIPSQSSSSCYSAFHSSLLFCLVLLSSHCVSDTYGQSLSFRDNVDCTYANSTCSTCSRLCAQNEFYPLFPSRCHPLYDTLTHSSESYPGRISTSVRFFGNSSYSVPADFLPDFKQLNNYTIAVYFKEQSTTVDGNLLQLNTGQNSFTFRYTMSRLELVSEGKSELLTTYDQDSGGVWKSLFINFIEPNENGFTISIYLTTQSGSMTTVPPMEQLISIETITVGENFDGLLQDVRLYTPVLQTMNSQVVVPEEASFLPQCLCPSGFTISEGEAEECVMNEQSLIRYNISAHPADFSTDSSLTTSWQSATDITNPSSVSLVVGLAPPVSLSKIFVTFNSSLPAATTLEYYSVQDSTWRHLQYFARDCSTAFSINDELNEPTAVNCLEYTSTSSLAFLLAGSEGIPRPMPTSTGVPFETYYQASRVRVTMRNVTDSATYFAIEDVVICPNYCFDLEQSCTSCDEGSGMFTSDILAPTTTATSAITSVLGTAATSSTVDFSEINSNTFVSIAMSTFQPLTSTAFVTTVMPATSMSLTLPMTMTFMSSVNPIVTSLILERSSSAVDLSSNFMSPTTVFQSIVMTSALFEQPITSIVLQVGPTSSASAISEISTSVLPSLLPTPTPTITESSEQVVPILTTTTGESVIPSSSRQVEEIMSSSRVDEDLPLTPALATSALVRTSQVLIASSLAVTSAIPATTITTTAPFTSMLVSSIQDQTTSTNVIQPSVTSILPSFVEDESTTSGVIGLSSFSSSFSTIIQPSLSSAIPETTTVGTTIESSTTQISSIDDSSTGMDITPVPSASSAVLETSPSTSTFVLTTNQIDTAFTSMSSQFMSFPFSSSSAMQVSTVISELSSVEPTLPSLVVSLTQSPSIQVSTPILTLNPSLQESSPSLTPISTVLISEVPTSTTSVFTLASATTAFPIPSSVASVQPTIANETFAVDATPIPTFVLSLSTAISSSLGEIRSVSILPTGLASPSTESVTAIVPTLRTTIPMIASMSSALQTLSESNPSTITISPGSSIVTPTLAVTPSATPTHVAVSMSNEIAISLSPEPATSLLAEAQTTSRFSGFPGIVTSSVERTVATTAVSISSTPAVFETPDVPGSGSGDFDLSLLFPEISSTIAAPTSSAPPTPVPSSQSFISLFSTSISESISAPLTENATSFIMASTPIPLTSIELIMTTTELDLFLTASVSSSEVAIVTPTSTMQFVTSSPVSTPMLSMSPTSVVISSAIPTSSFIFPSPSPSPTPAVSPTAVVLPLCETPVAPLQVDTEELGFISSEVLRDESDSEGLTYSVEVGNFIGRSVHLSTSGALTAMFGSFSGESAQYDLNIGSVTGLTGYFISNREVWSDGPTISIAFQVRDGSLNSNIDTNCEIVLNNQRNDSVFTTEQCNVSSSCGTSTVSLDVPNQWFMENEETNVTVNVIFENRKFQLGYIVLMPTGQTQINDTVFMILPRRSLLPGEEFRVPIFASFDVRLASFSLDCRVNGTGAKLRGAQSNFTWSLLTTSHPDDSNRMSLTGFRSYDRTNTNKINFTESIAELIIAVHSEDQLFGESTIEIQCTAVKLILTTAVDLVKEEGPTYYVRSLNRGGENNVRGIVHLETRDYVGLFACTDQNEIVNTATLNTMTDMVDMNVLGFNAKTSALDLLSAGVNCSSEDDSVVKVDTMCTHIFFDGTETSGADSINILMTSADFEASGTMPLRVWISSQEINIVLTDSVLNAIETTASCENGSTTYQRSSLTITTDISTNMNVETVRVTSLLRPYLRVSDESIVHLTDNMLYVEGLAEGEAFVYVSTLGQSYRAEINVVNDTVEAQCFSIFTFSGIDIILKAPDEMSNFKIATISLSQDFLFVGSNLNIVPVVQFNDETVMTLTEEEYDSFEIDVSPEPSNSLRVTSPMSNSSYKVTSPIDDLDITVEWTLDSLLECEYIAFTSNYSLSDTLGAEIPSLVINATSYIITSSDDAAALFGTPTFVLLEAHLNYSSTFQSNITSNGDIQFEVVEGQQDLLRIVDHMGNTRRVETSSNDMSGVGTIRAIFSPLNVMAELTITVKRTDTFVLTAYNENGAGETSLLSRIGSSMIYQRARLAASISFSNRDTEEISNNDMIVSIVNDDLNVVNTTELERKLLQVSYEGTTDTMVTLQATIVNSNITSDDLYITVQSSLESIEVINITSISLTSTSAIVNDTIFVDCAVVLADNTSLTTTFTDDGAPIYHGLISFITIDTDVLLINDPFVGRLSLKKNSLEQVSFMASAGNSMLVKDFSVSLNPGPREIGLKPSATEVMLDEIFVISIVLNSADEAVGVYELELEFESVSRLELMDVVQGNNWKNGTVISAEKGSDRVTIGGVLNGGTQNSLAELATVEFRALKAGITSLNVTIDYISNANTIPTVIASGSSSLSGQIQLSVISSPQPSKREAPSFYDYEYSDNLLQRDVALHSHSRSKRATSCVPSTTDVNGDCDMNLIDVYVLQEFLSSEVYNFTTTEGQQLTERNITAATIGDTSISQIFELERASLDLSFDVNNVFYRFYLRDNFDCQFLVNGTVVSTANVVLNSGDIVSLVRVYLDFSSSNETFQAEFDSTFGGNEIIARKGGDGGQYGGTVIASVEDVGGAIFTIQANSSFMTEGFTLSVLLDVQTDVQVNQVASLGSFDVVNVHSTTVTGVIDSCIPIATSTMIIPTTSVTPTTSLFPSTTVETLAATTTQAATQAFSSPLIPTSTMVASSRMVSIASSVAPTTSVASTVNSISPSSLTVMFPTSTEVLMTTDVITPGVNLSSTVAPSGVESVTSTMLRTSIESVVLTSTPILTPLSSVVLASSIEASSTAVVQASRDVSEVATTTGFTVLSTTMVPSQTPSPTIEQSSTFSRLTSGTLSPEPSMIPSEPPVTTGTILPTITVSFESSPTPAQPPFTASEFTGPLITTEPVQTPTATTTVATTEAINSTMPTEPPTTTDTEAPITTTLLQTTITEAPTTTISLQTTTAEVPTTTMSLQTTTAEVPTTTMSLQTTTEAPTTTLLQTTTTEAPTTTTSLQMTTTEAPTTTIPLQTTTTEAPTTTTSLQMTTTEALTTTISLQTTTIEASTTTTSLQMTTTEAPTATTSLQMTTTEALTTITQLQMTTTEAPATTTSLPITTTELLVTSAPPLLLATTDASTTMATKPPTMAATEAPTTTTPTNDGNAQSTSSTDNTNPEESSNTLAIIIGAILGLIASILAAVVCVFIAVYAIKKHRKKTGIYRPQSSHNTPSRGNKGYFFEEEERVELNPVNCDLVPMEPINSGHFFMETGAESMNLVPNHHIYHGDMNTGEDMIMSGNSIKPLIREPPEPGRQVPARGKQSYTNYSESTMDHPPPPYHATGTTITGTTLSSKSGNSTSPYDIEDDYFDLPFNDDPTQAYLSLGLTPLSQLSPPDHTGSGSDGNNFFPSMPPPVMPSAFNSGIPVDSPFNISGSSGGGMVMPDAFPSVTDQPRKSSGGRRNRHEHNPLSQGYPIKLAPVPEQSDPIDDSFSQPYAGKRTRHGMYNGQNESSSSESNDESSNLMMFPSADLANSNSQLQRQGGKRRKSGTRRIENGWSQSSQDAMVFTNQGAMQDEVPERDIPPYIAQSSPRQKGKYLRQQAREQELFRQKELLKKKVEDEERRRILQQEQRAAMIARDYGSTRYREVDIDQQVLLSQRSGRVLQEAMKFEAHMQLMHERETGSIGSQSQGMNNNFDRMSQERRIMSPKRQSSYSHDVTSYDVTTL